MSSGFSHRLVEQINHAYQLEPANPVYQLGKLCVDNNIMLATVADKLGTTKQAVYRWYSEGIEPKPERIKKIEKLVTQLQKKTQRDNL